MRFKNDVEKQMFLDDQKYCQDRNSYCLGSTMEEAAEVITELIELNELEMERLERESYVGMD